MYMELYDMSEALVKGRGRVMGAASGILRLRDDEAAVARFRGCGRRWLLSSECCDGRFSSDIADEIEGTKVYSSV